MPSRIRTRFVCVAVVGALFFCFVWAKRVNAQPPSALCSNIKYPGSLTGYRGYRLNQIEGQTVYGEIADRGEPFAASGVCVALFNRGNRQLVAVATATGNGQFQFADVPRGAYVLIAWLGPLREVIVPLLLMRRPLSTANGDRLLLHMRAKEDSRKSFASKVAEPALRVELLQRVVEDQAIRHDLIKHGSDHPDPVLEERARVIDARNTARMKQIVKRYGWPGPNLVGLDGADAAFLMVQHAAHPFHKMMAPHVKKAYRDGGLSASSYALFVDRLLSDSGKPQLYGTRLKRWNRSEPVLYPIADEVNVDKRRAALGLSPLSEYLKWLKQMYFPER